MVFRIQPHVRLQEWVGEERGFFTAEGLDYEFEPTRLAGGTNNPRSAGELAPGRAQRRS